MICPERDQDLLLLAHGALPWTQALRVKWHLCVCKDCQVRFAQMTHISTLLATEVRDPSMPRWVHPQASQFSRQKIMGLIAVLFLSLGLATLIYQRLTPHVPSGASNINAPLSGGCRPDLPNSRCR